VEEWGLDWLVGLPIIVATVVLHVFGLALIADFVERVADGRVERSRHLLQFGSAVSLAALLATLLHAFEAFVWASVYLGLGASGDLGDSVLYSLNAITSYGHERFMLEKRWELLGAMEAVNGMMLFGLTTAFLFAVIQRVRSSGA
jgi:hypothetical protein